MKKSFIASGPGQTTSGSEYILKCFGNYTSSFYM